MNNNDNRTGYRLFQSLKSLKYVEVDNPLCLIERNRTGKSQYDLKS